MDTQQEIYEKLMQSYQKTHKIGPAKPYNMEHAKKIAWAAAKNIYNKQQKLNTTALFAPEAQGPRSPVGCCQLGLFQ